MGYLDGLTANLLRSGQDGRLYYAPAGKLGPLYLVPDAKAAARLRQVWQRFFIVLFVVAIATILAVGPAWIATAGWKLLIPLPVAALVSWLFGLIVGRGLPRAAITHRDLAPLSQSDLMKAYSTATGRRTLRLLLAVSVFMAVASVLVALLTPSVTLWVSAAFIVFCSVTIYRAWRRS